MGGWGRAIEVAALPFLPFLPLLFLTCGRANKFMGGAGVGITAGLGIGVGVRRLVRHMGRATKGIGRDIRGSFGGVISGRGRFITVEVFGVRRGMGLGGLVTGRGRV